MAHMVKGRQYMYSLGLCVCYTSFTEMNSTDRCFSLIQRRTRQHSTDRYVARVRMAHQTYVKCNAVCVLYIALASFIYTWDYVSQKNA